MATFLEASVRMKGARSIIHQLLMGLMGTLGLMLGHTTIIVTLKRDETMGLIVL